MKPLRAMFGGSKTEVWKRLSDTVGGEYIAGSLLHDDAVVAHIDGWTVTLDTFEEPIGRAVATYTRMRAPYVNHDGFRFAIYRQTLLARVGKLLRMQDVEIGDPAFDAAFMIKANREEEVRALLADAQLRHLISAQPSLHLEVKDDEGRFAAHFPEGVDELYFAVPGVIADLPRLKGLYDLFAETLHQLCHIGSAYESDPHLDLRLTS